MPIFFIFTQKIDEDTEMKNYVKKELKEIKNIEYLDVLAKEKIIRNGIKIPSFGVDKLVKQTNEKIKNIKDMAYFKKFQNIFMKSLYKEYDDSEKEFFNSFTSSRIINSINRINGIDSSSNLTKCREKFCEILLKQKFFKFSFGNNKEIEDEIYHKLLNSVNEKFCKNYISFLNKLKDYFCNMKKTEKDINGYFDEEAIIIGCLEFFSDFIDIVFEDNLSYIYEFYSKKIYKN